MAQTQSVRSTRRKGGVKKVRRTLSAGQVHIFATFNNTIVTVTDPQGNTVAWGSAGSAGFKGSRKSTPFAARLAAEQAIKAAMTMGLQEAELFIKGPGPGRESAIRAVQSLGLKVTAISDITPVPHNGCRPPKKRRV
jgi:small subunit ribosomal protein S11